jgi:hypothetical protein
MTTMEIAAYAFFIALLGGSVLIGTWLQKGKYKGKV